MANLSFKVLCYIWTLILDAQTYTLSCRFMAMYLEKWCYTGTNHVSVRSPRWHQASLFLLTWEARKKFCKLAKMLSSCKNWSAFCRQLLHFKYNSVFYLLMPEFLCMFLANQLCTLVNLLDKHSIDEIIRNIHRYKIYYIYYKSFFHFLQWG